jgi:rod shape-determining protein MreD
MRDNYFITILLFFLLLLIQTTFVPLIEINGVVPDLLLILLVYYTLKHNQMYGTILGFTFGLFFDLIAGSIVGSTMISKTLAGFTAGYFADESRQNLASGSYLFALIVLLCAMIDSVISAFFSVSDLSRNFLLLFFEQGVLPAFYTAAVSLLVIVFFPRRGIN